MDVERLVKKGYSRTGPVEEHAHGKSFRHLPLHRVSVSSMNKGGDRVISGCWNQAVDAAGRRSI